MRANHPDHREGRGPLWPLPRPGGRARAL